MPTTETPTGFGASGANNKCLWFFFFDCYRRQGPIPQNQYVINYNTRHTPALLTVYFLTPPPAPNDSPGGPLMSSVAHYCVQSLHDSEHREREREHLLLRSFTSIWNGWLERNLSCFFPTPLSLHFPFLSLSLSSWVLGFRELNFLSLEFYFIFWGGGR